MFGLSGLEELVIALGILVVAVVLFVLWRMGFLNRKTLPIVGGVLAGIGGTAPVPARPWRRAPHTGGLRSRPRRTAVAPLVPVPLARSE